MKPKPWKHAIFTEGETLDELKQNIKEAIHCHFEVNAPPKSNLSSQVQPENTQPYRLSLSQTW